MKPAEHRQPNDLAVLKLVGGLLAPSTRSSSAPAAGSFFESARGVLGDVFGEGAGGGAGGEDAGDGVVVEGAEGVGVAQGADEVGGRVALAQQQDLARVIGRQARLGDDEAGDEVIAPSPTEGDAPPQLLDVLLRVGAVGAQGVDDLRSLGSSRHPGEKGRATPPANALALRSEDTLKRNGGPVMPARRAVR